MLGRRKLLNNVVTFSALRVDPFRASIAMCLIQREFFAKALGLCFFASGFASISFAASTLGRPSR